MEYAFSEPLSQTTADFRVSVRNAYIQEESSPEQQYFVFAYQVEIFNDSAYPVKLLRRYWEIWDGGGQREVVQGDGVVGQQPIILPGQIHAYISGAHFKTPVGKMRGHYTLLDFEEGNRFDILIPPFFMMVPYLNN